MKKLIIAAKRDQKVPFIWYKASEFEGVVELKETRIKELLSDLFEQGKIETIGNTKGKLYRKVKQE